MKVYRYLGKLFPRSFTAKVFFLAFCGTHVPLLTLMAYVPVTSAELSSHLEALVVVLVATMVATAATFLSLKAVLSPIYEIEKAMQDFEEKGAIEVLPLDMDDELGRLMQRTVRMMQRLNVRIQSTEREAETDPLTGVLNRRGFDRRVGPNDAGAVLQFDLDHFKSVNDQHGHQIGDDVLRAVAQIMGLSIRKDDVLARVGGEEFVVFLRGATRVDAALSAERIRSSVERKFSEKGIPVTTSVGISVSSDTLQARLAEADRATYQAKREGRNRVSFYERAA